ncbi:MAG: hypothetical protein IPL65_19440 [Lewinellaceae bacterium]|nr:hypothetical protein [Lewinellaceae bacterium]
MEKSRLIKLLRTLSDFELRSLKRFVGSDYFNRRPEVGRLLFCLEPYLKSGLAVPDKLRLFQQVFPDYTYDDHRLRMAISFLNKCCVQFLVLESMQANPQALYLEETRVMRRRGLPDAAASSIQAAFREEEHSPFRNTEYFGKKYTLALEQYRLDVDRKSQDEINLQPLYDQLDEYYLAQKMWHACMMLSHQAVSRREYELGMLDASLAYIESRDLLDKPAIALYYYCYRALTLPDKRVFFELFKAELMQSNHLFPDEELRDLYILAVNFCIRQYNQGNSDYLRDQFDFYREGFKYGYFLVEGGLSRYTYLNAATSGLVMHELDWVEDFVYRYKDVLQPAHRESLFAFNLARLEYQRGRLDDALLLLQKAEYKDVMLALAAKTLQMKIYYAMDAYDLLESHLQALKVFIRRKKELGYHKENYLNTIRFVERILEIRPGDKNSLLDLRNSIQQTGAVAEKEWLLEQVAPTTGRWSSVDW